MRQGNEHGAGTKHSIFRHYGTSEGRITADDILLIPDVLANGERTEKRRGNVRLVEYRLIDGNGIRHTIITEMKGKGEVFYDYYTNRKSSSSYPVNAKGDTDSTAQTNEDDALSPAKLQKVSESSIVKADISVRRSWN